MLSRAIHLSQKLSKTQIYNCKPSFVPKIKMSIKSINSNKKWNILCFQKIKIKSLYISSTPNTPSPHHHLPTQQHHTPHNNTQNEIHQRNPRIQQIPPLPNKHTTPQ